MNRNDDRRSPPTATAVPRLQRRTLRQLTLVELGKVAAGRPTRCGTTTGIENECLTRDVDP